ncbi:IclR family transcriptional regulator [Streptomyces sp. H27-D2]|uniref:IclR family transcriptional regulator n=1 Tax=Streptomyces sp. H27-D2 TaxID=3046304 RepID=UPI002DB887F0|nr:helix-turn-helix domain-containing protein [Streptomyces sp. H27-D2]MEC4015784.1 helix-turn-helix domain-containing protein [Streptomyces sp. H27-D2]
MVNGEAVAHPTLIGSVRRALRLLEAVGSHAGGAPAKQLARETGIPLPTTYHLLRTLTHEGYLHRRGGVFVFGESAEFLGTAGARQRRRAQLGDVLAEASKALGAAVYFAVYRDGEIEVVAVADTPDHPAVAEWVDFRATGHAHAIGKCLLGQLDEQARRDHFARYPVHALTPYSVADERELMLRLDAARAGQVVYERQEYVLGTVCAAVPISVGSAVATLAVSLPLNQGERLRPVAEELRLMAEKALTSLSFSISI